MSLSEELVSQFVKATNDGGRTKAETTVYGTVNIMNNQPYVKIDGSDIQTPALTTTEVGDDDRVIVQLKNHTATITGNTSNPAIGVRTEGSLRSEISQTAASIRLEVEDKANGLKSSIELTASQIRQEVNDSVSGLNSSITQNADSITSLITKQDEFSKFQQDVNGFAFMNKGGTVKISSGSINLTGAITFGDLDAEVKDSIDTANSNANAALDTANSASSIASSANTTAGNALIKAESAEDVANIAYNLAANSTLPDYLHSTYIDQTIIMSPSIVGGTFYSVDEDSYTIMNGDGFYLYFMDDTNPKAMISYTKEDAYTGTDEAVKLILGAGQNNETYVLNRFFVEKTSTQVSLYYSDRNGDQSGFRFNTGGTIDVIGTLNGVGSSTGVIAVWG